MALCACKCLNVTLESDKLEEMFDIGKLSSTEQRDTFFNEKLLICQVNELKVNLVQPALIGRRTVDHLTLESCLACGQTTHAILHDKNLVLMPKSIQTTLEHINSLKSSGSFSPVFNLIVPEVNNDVEMKENVDTSNQLVIDKNGCSSSLQMIGSLKKQLNQTLQSHLEAIEEAVSQFRDQKYAEYEVYRAKAQRDHKILSSIISKAQSNIEKENWANNSNFASGPPSPLVPPLQRRRLSSLKDAKKFTQKELFCIVYFAKSFFWKHIFSSIISKAQSNIEKENWANNSNFASGPPSPLVPPLQRRRLSSLKDAKKFTQKSTAQIPHEEDSLDAEDIFDLEGTDFNNFMGSDHDDYDSDQGSNDEGIHIGRQRGIPNADIARSLPITVPKFGSERPAVREVDDYEEPQDIAASIKALARSVHGDVFELPRPRFSTQI
ncbi:jg8193 [Pararge aegeria aegeria]|uniref:Jg8193 protein n=1 Tax=Pararge aegeria aegeria TaxID=348720 RepID=A0A8S4SII7_9NEOP|nr:jg8193 [Pararge aegeria aegeria]